MPTESNEPRSSYCSSPCHLGEVGTTGGRGTESTGTEGGYSSSESEPSFLTYSTLVRVERLWGTQRSLEGSLLSWGTSETMGASNPTVNCAGAVECSVVGKIPCVRRWRLAFERTAKLFVQVGMGHLYAVTRIIIRTF